MASSPKRAPLSSDRIILPSTYTFTVPSERVAIGLIELYSKIEVEKREKENEREGADRERVDRPREREKWI